MKKWKTVNIGSLGQVVTGNTPLTSDREFYGGTHPFIKPTDMDIDRRRVTTWEENYSEKAFKKYINSYIPVGSTGVVTIGTVGEKLFQADQPCFTNQSVNVVIPDTEKYNADFVYYLMKYNLPHVSAANPGTASGRHHVSKSNFCSIKVQVPEELKTQAKIASILSAYDDLIENNLKRIKLLEEIAHRTYEDWYLNRKINNKIISINKFETIPLNVMIESYMNGGWGTEENEGNNSIGAYVIRGTDMPDIQSGNFSKLPLRFHSEKNLLPRKLKTGDIIIEMSNGNINSIGRSYFYDGSLEKIFNFPFICASFCKMLRPKSIEFAYIIDLHIKYIHATNSMLVYKSQGANGINNFRFEDMIKEEELFVPKGDNLNLLVNNTKNYYSQMSNLRSQNKYLKESRDILLPRLMSGLIEIN